MRSSNKALRKLDRASLAHDFNGYKDNRVIYMEIGIAAMTLMFALEAEGFCNSDSSPRIERKDQIRK